MSLARYFVFRREAGWVVALDGRQVGCHDTRDAALRSATIMADLMGTMRHDADVMVEDESGLGLAWTYGVDPLPLQRADAA